MKGVFFISEFLIVEKAKNIHENYKFSLALDIASPTILFDAGNNEQALPIYIRLNLGYVRSLLNKYKYSNYYDDEINSKFKLNELINDAFGKNIKFYVNNAKVSLNINNKKNCLITNDLISSDAKHILAFENKLLLSKWAKVTVPEKCLNPKSINNIDILIVAENNSDFMPYSFQKVILNFTNKEIVLSQSSYEIPLFEQYINYNHQTNVINEFNTLAALKIEDIIINKFNNNIISNIFSWQHFVKYNLVDFHDFPLEVLTKLDRLKMIFSTNNDLSLTLSLNSFLSKLTLQDNGFLKYNKHSKRFIHYFSTCYLFNEKKGSLDISNTCNQSRLELNPFNMIDNIQIKIELPIINYYFYLKYDLTFTKPKVIIESIDNLTDVLPINFTETYLISYHKLKTYFNVTVTDKLTENFVSDFYFKYDS